MQPWWHHHAAFPVKKEKKNHVPVNIFNPFGDATIINVSKDRITIAGLKEMFLNLSSTVGLLLQE